MRAAFKKAALKNWRSTLTLSMTTENSFEKLLLFHKIILENVRSKLFWIIVTSDVCYTVH